MAMRQPTPWLVLKIGTFPTSATLPKEVSANFGLVEWVSIESVAQLSHVPESVRSNLVGLVCTIQHRITAEVLAQLPNLRVVASYGAGTDHLDLEATRARGIVVTNTPGILGNATADLTWALILSVSRRVVYSDQCVRAGAFSGWQPTLHLGMELAGKTLGLIGMGDIGQRVAKRAFGFDMPVMYYNRQQLSASTEQALNARYCSLTSLLAQSDVVSIHTPLTAETRYLLNRDRLRQMKPGSILINTSRGPVVEENALVEALTTGHLAGAGLDVFEEEPAIHPGLLGLDNVVLTAHIGSATYETRQHMGDRTLENLLAALQGQTPRNQVP
ncbi:MAG: D-glycerate dehydrogenase [Candidatus Melainabacteria bacterium]|nr:D-glycerate dehydrogenase [Candidatus Melainabacteria bacterium]